MASAVKVVTAFTVSHSLTLSLAAFGILRIPSALTESLIAATITLAAINNIFPVVTKKLWLVALGFGLIHGVGFANVLADLELPRQNLLTALLAFNLGVEFGQLAIVVVVLPLLMLCGPPGCLRSNDDANRFVGHRGHRSCVVHATRSWARDSADWLNSNVGRETN